jgi:hypothetical protein
MIIRYYAAGGALRQPHVRRSVAKLIGGYHLTRGEGGWVDADGRLIEEPSDVLEIGVSGSLSDFGSMAAAVVPSVEALIREAARDADEDSIAVWDSESDEFRVVKVSF